MGDHALRPPNRFLQTVRAACFTDVGAALGPVRADSGGSVSVLP